MSDGVIWAMWLSIAILTGGLARERGRSAWTWFLLGVLFGPLASALVVVWPRVSAVDLKHD
jgi:hypothetical protein